MREFEYFLFENFDADKEANNPSNPRNFLGTETNEILTEVTQFSFSYDRCYEKYSVQLVRKLIDGGILRSCGGEMFLDCPVFLQEDAVVLCKEIASKGAELVDLLQKGMTEIRECCLKIDNGFPVELNLYHILCGMVFDGMFFEYLSNKGVLATSRLHSSGLDYLTVIYEKCDELYTLSDGLLCSYNRFANEKCSLQSFGDANGNRFDFYRFYRLREQGKCLDKFRDAEMLLNVNNGGEKNKDSLLSEVISLVQTGRCSPDTMVLLELFGYARNGKISVPVYTREHQIFIVEIENIVEKHLGEAMANILLDLASSIDITAVKHGVNRLEISNELYHIVFGFMNEELVARGSVARPKHIPGEGRFFKCIEVN